MSDEYLYKGLSFESELRQIGLNGIRVAIESGAWKAGSPGKHGEAVEVVRRFNAAEAATSSAKRDAREEETLSIAKRASVIAEEALSIAKTANRLASEDLAAARSTAASERAQARWAMWAAIIATIAAVIATKDQILALIF